MSDQDQAMTIIENLSEELGDKELRIMELEKQNALLKKQLEEKNEILSEADEMIHNIYIEPCFESIMKDGPASFLVVGEEYEEDVYQCLNVSIFNYIIPTSLCDECCIHKYYGKEFKVRIKNDTDCIIIIRRIE